MEYVKVYKEYMIKTKQKYERLLLETLLLILRYDAHLNEFRKIDIQDLQQFTTKHVEPLVTEYFKQKNIFKLQVFLFNLIADIGLDSGVQVDATQIANHIGYITKQLSDDLSPLLKAVLNQCENDCKQLRHYLLIITKGPNWCVELDTIFINSFVKNIKGMSLIRKSNVFPQNKPAVSSLQSVLTTLHLVEKYPQQLGLRDALMIKPEIKISDINLNNLPYMVLHKIIACDHRSRSFLLTSENDDNIIDDESDSEASDSDSENSYNIATNNQSMIHPVDIILALLHCSDNFLRQVLLVKLSICQMAIPLLLPDTVKGTLTLLIWALRSVKKTWNTLDSSGIFFARKSSIVDYEGPVISFLKCGKLQVSKSEILNNVIGEEDIFFHWHLEKYPNCRKKYLKEWLNSAAIILAKTMQFLMML